MYVVTGATVPESASSSVPPSSVNDSPYLRPSVAGITAFAPEAILMLPRQPPSTNATGPGKESVPDWTSIPPVKYHLDVGTTIVPAPSFTTRRLPSMRYAYPSSVVSAGTAMCSSPGFAVSDELSKTVVSRLTDTISIQEQISPDVSVWRNVSVWSPFVKNTLFTLARVDAVLEHVTFVQSCTASTSR